MSLATFWSKVKSFFSAVLKKAPSVLTDAQLALAGIGPIAEAADPAAAPAIQVVVTQGVNDIDEIQSLVAAYEANPTAGTLSALQSGFTVVYNGLPSLLSAADIKDAGFKARILGIMTAVDAMLKVYESQVVAVHTATVPAAVAAATPPIL